MLLCNQLSDELLEKKPQKIHTWPLNEIFFFSISTSVPHQIQTSIYKTQSHAAPCHSDSSGRTLRQSHFVRTRLSILPVTSAVIDSSPKVIFQDVLLPTSSSFPLTLLEAPSVCLCSTWSDAIKTSLSRTVWHTFPPSLWENESCAGWGEADCDGFSTCLPPPPASWSQTPDGINQQVIHVVSPPKNIAEVRSHHRFDNHQSNVILMENWK